MKEKATYVLVTVGWAVMVSSIILQCLYVKPGPTALELALIFIVSFLAGMALVDASVIVFSFVGSLLTSMLLMFFCLTLPATLGRLEYAILREKLYESAMVMIFRSMILPFPTVFLCLIGGFVGGIIGERLRFL